MTAPTKTRGDSGVTLRRIPEGTPGAGAAVLRLHYSCDPTMLPERVARLKATFASPARWEREMEIIAEAMSGERFYPNYIPEQNDCDPFPVDDTKEWTIWQACDPHQRTPHAFAWEAFNREGDSVLCGELWTKEKYWGCKEWAETIAWLESDSTDKPDAWVWARGKRLDVVRRIMDTHGSAANSEEGPDFFATYAGHGLHYAPASKSHQILSSARDKVDAAFTPQIAYRADGTPFLHPRRHIFRTCKQARFEYMNVRYPEGDTEKPSQEKPKTYVRHITDASIYVHSTGGRFVERVNQNRQEFEPLYTGISY